MAEQQAVQLLGERLKDAKDRVAELKRLVNSAQRVANSAAAAADSAEQQTGISAAKAYQEYAAVPETLREFAPGLEHLAPGLRDSAAVSGEAAADAYTSAVSLATIARQTLTAAQKALLVAEAKAAKLELEFQRRSKALQDLVARNAAELRKAQEAADDYAGGYDYDPGAAVKGLKAHPKALKAVRYALRQLGKPYRWGDEGPGTFDCSGLVWAAYHHAGVNLTARTARQQYRATTKVAAGHLLPGDLVFFGKNRNNVDSIHHVGIYIGKGKIVHAPTAGDVVKISPIWWWEYFGATRVVPAVKSGGGSSDPKPDPKPKPTPKPTPTPSWSPSPSSPAPPPSPEPSNNPEPGDSVSPTASPPDAPQVSPAPGDSGSGDSGSGDSASRSGSAACPSPSPTPSGSASPTPSPSPTPSASASASADGCRDSGEAGFTTTSNDGSGSNDGAALPLEQKPATVASRRRTRAGSKIHE
ncbi:MAG: NlpC/P60 family protein [Micromonosporaceae bacterium]|nr:NlpC/P60 family protein [Micromonosporaceae bacterium]